MHTREQKLGYIEKHRLPQPDPRARLLRVDRNLWGCAAMREPLEDPWTAPTEDIYQITTAPSRAPARAESIEIEFDCGRPVALGAQKMRLLELVERVSEAGGRHGVGRQDLVEDRITGVKARQIYESPGATIFSQAHRALEAITLGRPLLTLKDELARRYAQLVYDGFWFSEARESLDAFFDRSQRYVTGTVRLRLLKGSCQVTGRRSPHGLYDASLATTGKGDTFDPKLVHGFARMWSLSSRAEAMRRRSAEPPSDSGGLP